MPSSTISKSKKYSRKRNYRKRRHSRRMQRKSRSRNAYNRRRRTMFGGAPEGVYIVTPVKNDDSNGNNEVSQQNSKNEACVDLLVSMGYVFYDGVSNKTYYSTAEFNSVFTSITTNTKELYNKPYTITITQNGDNYNVNLKNASDASDASAASGDSGDSGDSGLKGDVIFTKVTDESEKKRITTLSGYKPSSP